MDTQKNLPNNQRAVYLHRRHVTAVSSNFDTLGCEDNQDSCLFLVRAKGVLTLGDNPGQEPARSCLRR